MPATQQQVAQDVRPIAGALFLVPTGLLHPDPANARIGVGPREDLIALGQSMLDVGVIEPLVVEPDSTGGFLITAGHRRHAAGQMVGIDSLPCLVRRPAGRARRAAVAAAENFHRVQLTPMEEARQLRELIRANPDRDLADITRAVFGRSIAWARDRLLLLQLPADAQRLVETRQLPTTAAITLARSVNATGAGSVRTQEERCAPHFTTGHRLAGVARAACDHARHPQRGRVGSVACGSCWETAILTHQHVQRVSA